MAKRKTDIEEWRLHKCDECANGTYDMQFKNLSIYGTPTLIICRHEKWKKIVGSPACYKFIKK